MSARKGIEVTEYVPRRAIQAAYDDGYHDGARTGLWTGLLVSAIGGALWIGLAALLHFA